MAFRSTNPTRSAVAVTARHGVETYAPEPPRLAGRGKLPVRQKLVDRDVGQLGLGERLRNGVLILAVGSLSASTCGSGPGRSRPGEVELENRGVAPFYADWPVEFSLIGADGSMVKSLRATGKLTGLLPGDRPRVWDEKLDLKDVKAGNCKLALRVPNPLPKGNPVRFANRTQDADARGWLTLGTVEH